MRTNVIGLVRFGSVALLALVAFASSANAQSKLEIAANHAIKGPDVKKLKVMNHEFNIKKVRVVKVASGVTITGQLSHHLSLREDDQVFYTIKKSNGQVTAVEMKIDRGGLAPYVSKLASKLIGTTILESKIESTIRDIGRSYDGNWESAADAIIATVALKYQDKPYVPATKRPSRVVPTTVTQGATVRDHRSR